MATAQARKPNGEALKNVLASGSGDADQAETDAGETEGEGDGQEAEGAAEGSEDVEAQARAMGWRPKSEFKGDPKKFVPADEFVRIGTENIHVLNARLKRQSKDITEMRTLMRDLVGSQKAQQEKAVNDAIAGLKAQKKVAVAEADTDQVEAIDAQLDNLKKPVNGAGKKDGDGSGISEDDATTVSEWEAGNRWFDRRANPDLCGAAEGYLNLLDVRTETKDLPLDERLALVAAHVKKKYPERFPGRRPSVQNVEGGTSAPRRRSDRSYEALPQVSRDMCDRLVRQKVTTREKYVADYQWE